MTWFIMVFKDAKTTESPACERGTKEATTGKGGYNGSGKTRVVAWMSDKIFEGLKCDDGCNNATFERVSLHLR